MVASVAGPGAVLGTRAGYKTFALVFHREGHAGTRVAANASARPSAAPVPAVMHSKPFMASCPGSSAFPLGGMA